MIIFIKVIQKIYSNFCFINKFIIKINKPMSNQQYRGKANYIPNEERAD